MVINFFMRNTSLLLACLLLTGLVLSCKRNAQDAATPVVIRELILEHRNGADCDKADTLARTDCARISLHWPEVKQGSDVLKKNVAQWAGAYLSGMLNPSPDGAASTNTNVEEAARAFFTEHQKMEKSAMTGGWTTESNFKVLLNDGQYLTLEITAYSYQGGAHGNPTAAVATFDVKTGKQLTWDDLVADKASFQSMAEQEFRYTRSDIFQPTDGNEAFEFDSITPFALAQNFGLVQEGMYMHYIPYEVGPYAIGNTQMVVPYAEWKSLAKVPLPAMANLNPVSRPRPVPPAVTPAKNKPTSTQPKTEPQKALKQEQKTATAPKKVAAAKPTGPTVTLKQNGDMLVGSKKVADLDAMRKELQALLLAYPVIPASVPLNTVGQTGMGMRAEIRDVINESIAGAKWVRKKSALAALNTAVGKKLDMSTTLEPLVYKTSGQFAYISARPKMANGAPVDYSRTDYARDQSAKWFSDNAIGLLRYEKGAWKVLTYSIGVKQAPVSTWVKKYGAPKSVF